MKNYNNLEVVTKGFASRQRIRILHTVSDHPELNVDQLASQLRMNYRTLSMHLRKMHRANLVSKTYDRANVRIKITDFGQKTLKFLQEI